MEEETGTETQGEEFANISILPEGVIANILSLTSPSDACRSSAVSRIFNAAAQSAIVWDRFLPTDWDVLISHRKSGDLNVGPNSTSKKDIFFSLCNSPVLIDDGNKSFSLDKRTGKKCIMLGARNLSIVWGDTTSYWTWQHHPHSRFAEVAVLIDVWWLEIRGRISCRMLSPKTTYAVYFVFQMKKGRYLGFDVDPVDAIVGILGTENQNNQKSVYLDPYLPNPRWRPRRHGPWLIRPPSEYMSRSEWPQERHDGWFEIKLGEFQSGDGDDEVEIALMEVKGNSPKSGLIVEGIEIRPKRSQTCCIEYT